MTKRLLFVFATSAILMSGCATKERLAHNQSMADRYYAQQRTMKPVSLVFQDGRGAVTISGLSHLTVENPLNPLDAPGYERGGAEIAADVGKAIIGQAPVIAAGVVAYRMAKQPRTVDPVVVKPEVVHADVVPTAGVTE